MVSLPLLNESGEVSKRLRKFNTQIMLKCDRKRAEDKHVHADKERIKTLSIAAQYDSRLLQIYS